MELPDPNLEPDWDDDNINHIARHGITPEQVEEVYYGEGSLPTLAVGRKSKLSGRQPELRYRLWGIDAAGNLLEVIVAPYPEYGVWRCVTAYRMSATARRAYLKRVRR